MRKRHETASQDSEKIIRITMLLAVLVAHSSAGCAEGGPYSVKDSGRTSGGIYGWLDNERVLFQSESPMLKLQPNPSGKGQYVWNVSTGIVTRDASLEGTSNICPRGDTLTFIRKSAIDDNKWLAVTRTKDGEVEKPLINFHWFNRFSCRYYDHKPEWVLPNHKTLPLLEEHGFLDWFPSEAPNSTKNQPLRYHPKNSDGWIALPIGTREVWRTDVHYASFKDAYMLHPITYIDPATGKEEPIGPWPKGQPVPLWWLAPDGRVTTETVPYMRFMRGGSRSYYPTREGIFISTHKADGLGKPGDAGGYLVRNNQVIKLITGLLDSVSVSPNGCRITFIHDPYDTIYGKDRLERITVKSINLCDGGAP